MRKVAPLLTCFAVILLLGITYILWPFDGTYFVSRLSARNGLGATVRGGNLFELEPYQWLRAEVLKDGVTIIDGKFVGTWYGGPLQAYRYDFDFIYSEDEKYAVLVEKAHPNLALLVVDLDKKSEATFSNTEQLRTYFPFIEHVSYLED